MCILFEVVLVFGAAEQQEESEETDEDNHGHRDPGGVIAVTEEVGNVVDHFAGAANPGRAENIFRTPEKEDDHQK